MKQQQQRMKRGFVMVAGLVFNLLSLKGEIRADIKQGSDSIKIHKKDVTEFLFFVSPSTLGVFIIAKVCGCTFYIYYL